MMRNNHLTTYDKCSGQADHEVLKTFEYGRAGLFLSGTSSNFKLIS